MGISEIQLDYIISWAKDRGEEPFTVKDLQLSTGVHYQTAYNWVRELYKKGYFAKHPLKLSGDRSDRYVLADASQGENQSRTDIKIRRGQMNITPAFWASTHLNATDMASVAYALLYLFVRSYYAEAPDHQHLRGTVDEVVVRSFIAGKLRELEKDIEVIRQILSFRVPFERGSEFALRFGIPAEGFDMPKALEAANVFSQLVAARNTTTPVGEGEE